MTNIGFIGVGNMGGPMVRNLVKAGFTVRAFDLSATALKAAADAGASAAKTANDAASDADCVISMLPAGSHVRGVYLENGVLASAKKGALLIDCSTIDIDSARAVHTCRRKIRVRFSRCAGLRRRRRRGSRIAHLHVRRQRHRHSRARSPSFRKWASAWCWRAARGAGQAAKICNNMLLAISMIGTCEAFVLARKARPRSAKAVRHRVHIIGAMLVAHHLLPGSWPGADRAVEPRLCGRFRHRADAEGSETRAIRGAIVGRHHAAWCRSGTTLFALRRERPFRPRFLRHHSHAARRALNNFYLLLRHTPLRLSPI